MFMFMVIKEHITKSNSVVQAIIFNNSSNGSELEDISGFGKHTILVSDTFTAGLDFTQDLLTMRKI